MSHALWNIWAALMHAFGIDAGPTWPYGFWSGFGSCLTEFAIVGAVWHHLNCGVAGCWRLGRHHVAGTTHVVCRHHHPDAAPTHAQVLADHREAKEAGRA